MTVALPFAARPLMAGAALTLAATLIANAPARQRRPGALTTSAMPKGNAAAGRKLYAVCMGCHAIDDNDVGPKHRGVVGRGAGSVSGYAYSTALKTSKVVWTPANLDRWLQGPPKMVPGTKMFFAVAKPRDRADIIAYLATQK